jgi:hypothetical protein
MAYNKFNIIYSKYTKGLEKAISKKPILPNNAKCRCKFCSVFIPKYPGKYAKECPYCGKKDYMDDVVVKPEKL